MGIDNFVGLKLARKDLILEDSTILYKYVYTVKPDCKSLGIDNFVGLKLARKDLILEDSTNLLSIIITLFNIIYYRCKTTMNNGICLF